jgi:hypothetical protein
MIKVLLQINLSTRMKFQFQFTLLLTIFSSYSLNSQSLNQTSLASDTSLHLFLPGTVTWDLPAGLNSLIESYKRENYKEIGIDGFRIQLFSDGGNNAKDRAQTLLEEVSNSYPETPSYLTYQQPNFKVRIGNFRTKAEARQFQTILSQNYPGCFIVRDLIKVN